MTKASVNSQRFDPYKSFTEFQNWANNVWNFGAAFCARLRAEAEPKTDFTTFLCIMAAA